MQTKSREHIKVVTLGCAKNTVDSEKLLGQLIMNGFSVIPEHSSMNPSLVVINTCGFIHDAKEESIDTILAYVEEKRRGRVKKVVVMGCLAERYREELLREIPEIDGIFGVDHFPEILQSLGADYKKELTGERMLTTPSHVAYLKISEGCDRQCSFCAIPMIRGKYVSRPENEIYSEAEYLIEKGVKELILIAQDLTYYGMDLHRKRTLPELAGKLAALKGLEWLRLHYAFPSGFPLELLDVINAHPNICKYIDIPIQHINDRILRSMKRGMSKRQTIHLLETIRKRIPGVAIRTTLITGYPGETDREFGELRSFVENFRFDRLGVFTYSHEDGTTAFSLRDDIPERIKKERAGEIMDLQESISYTLNVNRINKVLKVIVEGDDSGYYTGRTEFDSPGIDNEVFISKEDRVLAPGNFYPVLITGAESYDLYGKVVND